MCPLNYWDMGYCIVILGIFRDVFGFWPKINFRDMGYLPILFKGYGILIPPLPPPPPPPTRLTNIRNHIKITKANYKFYLKNIYRWKKEQANKWNRKQNKNCDTFLVLCDLVLSTIKQHVYAKPVNNSYVLIKFPSWGDYKYVHKTRAYTL